MADSKTFQLALLLSILLHSVFFLGIPRMPFLPSRRSTENVKITYYKIREEPEKKTELRKKPEPILEKLPEIKKEEILKKPTPPAKGKARARPETKHVTVVRNKREKKFETVVREEQDEVKRATYISYYRAVRERIRQHADRNYPRRKMLGEGEVYLSFVVASSGELLQVVVERKSVNNPLLQKIAVSSVRDASPFPAFPKGMKQYQITFNVIISFELNR